MKGRIRSAFYIHDLFLIVVKKFLRFKAALASSLMMIFGFFPELFSVIRFKLSRNKGRRK